MTEPLELDDELIATAAEFVHDPYDWVMASFDWGAGVLKGQDGPRDWQRDVLIEVGEKLKRNEPGAYDVVREAVASGHGIGKSALVAWLILWAMSTMEDTKGVVTANTENQLKTKTWAELSKWYRLCAFRSWFKVTATAIFSSDPEHEKTWRIDMVPWSEKNTEAFAGLHNEGKRILLVFDEGSAIPDAIWEVAEGALTDEDTEIIWPAFGNPTRNTGRFKSCFGRLRHRWSTRQIDSRTVPGTNLRQIQEWVDDYGEDSDFVRIRVRGVFPRVGSNQFIGSGLVEESAAREFTDLQRIENNAFAPTVIGVDVARFGDDQSVIYFRKGRDGRGIEPLKYRGLDTMQLAGRVAEVLNGSVKDAEVIDACFIDGGGVGGGVVDRLRQLGHNVVDVNFGSRSSDLKYKNKRAEMWGLMRDWLKEGVIEDSSALEQDLIGPEYFFDANNAIVLESKEDMKKRGLASPDLADALALTFAFPVQRKPRQLVNVLTQTVKKSRGSDYDPLENA